MAPAKQKAQKMGLQAFLADETLGSWADEMDDMPLPSTSSGYGSRGYGGSSGGYHTHTENSGTDHRGFSIREELPLPTQPPYTAHVGNLSFDANQDDIHELFADCEVTSVRVVEDKLTQQPKGFGYVEFGSIEGLKKALAFQGTSMKGRNIRVSVAEPPKDRQDTREFDWSRKGPLPEIPSQRRGAPRAFDNMSDAGSERRGYEPADGKVRDFGNWERKGPMSPTLAAAAPVGREGRPRTNEGQQFRRASPAAWGEGRSQDGSRPPRREFQERPPVDREPTAPELDNQWRSRMRPDAPAPQPTSPVAAHAAPALTVRPKLNLQKRTVQESAASPTPSSGAGDAKASPFGAARPIDTAAKEREIEERKVTRQKELEEKAKADKERIAKEREEAKLEQENKKEQEEAAAATAAAAAAATAAKTAAVSSAGNKEETEVPQGAKNFEILQRVGESGEAVEGEGTPAAKTEGQAPAAAPKDSAREAPSQPAKSNGNWRNAPRSRGQQRGPRNAQAGGPPKGQGQGQGQGQSQAQAAPAAPAAPAASGEQEDDGWSTVAPKQRPSRRGRH